MLDLLTFALALAAYALLNATLAAVLAPPGRLVPGALPGCRVALARALALVALAHVALVWAHRFGGDLGTGLERGVPVFVSFHGATLAIVLLAVLVGRRPALEVPLVLIAWLGVAPSAAPAPFVHAARIDGIVWLGPPVLLLTLWGVLVLVAWTRAARPPAARMNLR